MSDDEGTGKVKEGSGLVKNDNAIEISDDEAPDIEQAKQRIREQNEKRRDK